MKANVEKNILADVVSAMFVAHRHIISSSGFESENV